MFSHSIFSRSQSLKDESDVATLRKLLEAERVKNKVRALIFWAPLPIVHIHILTRVLSLEQKAEKTIKEMRALLDAEQKVFIDKATLRALLDELAAWRQKGEEIEGKLHNMLEYID